MTSDQWKLQAAQKALTFVEPRMKLGLGTGSTAAHFVNLLGAKVAEGLDVVCVPTSEATRAQAAGLGIKLATLDDQPFLDLTVDGADELDGELRMIKGGGGALLREKIVATASQKMVVIADESKKVHMLGAFPLPVEVVSFGLKATEKMIEMLAAEAGCAGELRLREGPDGKRYKTDGGNYIFDCHFELIRDPEALADALHIIPGVVEHGLFLGIADVAIIAGPNGVTLLEADYDGEDLDV